MTLVRRDPADIASMRTPAEFQAELIAAQQKAAILREIVDRQGLAVKVGTQEHLKLEAWTTIGRAYGCSARTTVVELIRNSDEDVEGVKAHCDLLDDFGNVVGGADSFCFGTEDGKVGQTVAQLAGMAQTRAEARAFKEKFSWVVVLANYSATPVEEMTGAVAKHVQEEAEPRFFCQKHQTQWFKKGKMQGYAHPIKDAQDNTVAWCNMPQDVAEERQKTPPDPSEALAVSHQATPSAQATPRAKMANFGVLWTYSQHLGFKSKGEALKALAASRFIRAADTSLISDLEATADEMERIAAEKGKL